MAFYRYRQNNSGGFWDIDENVNLVVFIEANTADEAQDKAYDLGLSFGGCPCCGDRFSYPDEFEDGEEETWDGSCRTREQLSKKIADDRVLTESSFVYGKNPHQYGVVVHYANNTKEFVPILFKSFKEMYGDL